MDTANDRSNKTLKTVRTGAGALALSVAMLAAPFTEAGEYGPAFGGSIEKSAWIMSGVVAVSIQSGTLQAFVLGSATASFAVGVVRANLSRKGRVALQTLDGTQSAEFDIPPERLKAAGLKSGDPVEVHRGPAGWRLRAHGVDLAYYVDEGGSDLLTSVRR